MNRVRDAFDHNTFVVVVGRDRESGTAHDAFVRMKNTLRDQVTKYLRRGGIAFPLAARTAELVLAEKLASSDVGVVYLTAHDIAEFLTKAKADAGE